MPESTAFVVRVEIPGGDYRFTDIIGPFQSASAAEEWADNEDNLSPYPSDGGFVDIYMVSAETADTPEAYALKLTGE